MPLTFIDIERQKNWRILLFFLFLMLLYLAIIALFGAAFLPFSLQATRFWVFAISTAIIISGIHFWTSAYDAVHTVIRTLNAEPPDSLDSIHKTLSNIMHEVHIATGNRRSIQCVVIPSLSLNALAAADLKGEAVIGITEGLLSRLTRPQLETVIAHETHHILSGDCLETTIATSVFGAFSAIIEKTSRFSRGRSFSSPAILMAWVLLKLSYMLNMFISREREYRADAAAVRITRNPIALAETLHLLSRSWRGAGFIGSGFEMLCIVSPELKARDEAEGFWADLLSTHPPIGKRTEILLRMARVSISELDARADRKKREKSAPKAPTPGYFAMDPRQQWQGPFSLIELGALPWLSPLTWITTGDQEPVDRAWKEPLINAIFASQLEQNQNIEATPAGFSCPVCSQPLLTATYEGARVYQCHFCAGMLVENNKIPRILARTQNPCSSRVACLAKAVLNENQRKLGQKRLAGGNKNSVTRYTCPKCKNAMNRNFYNGVYLIEIDRCSFCEFTWFDHDELQMLEYLVENRVTPELTAPPNPVKPASSI